MQRERNDSGMTLLEIVISMAISIVVVLMIVSFINSGFRIFRKTNEQVMLQMEAQTSINQLVKLAIEAKGITDETDILINPDFIIYRIDSIDLAGHYDYAVIWRKDDVKKLYLVELIPPMNNIEDINFDNEEDLDREYLLAEYVTHFSIEPVVVTNTALKRITVRMALGNEEYEVSKEIILRNAEKPID